ncbi:pilus assembly protein Flp/PilA [Sphingomonas kaistensis]|uniref:Pilus assembly protein Flp/PilA n=1 Tax=Sphingomonas kaistensis TaxID=298708 RepID=A0A7X6BH70_9SPHN|nr:Flp family type IVb pilin [Sphingomonas kaistensis]NJC06638.1 pilus assembly protein Flp/PilA [Sphingomonas kaistensis]
MTFINMLKDEAGASAAEYALLLAIVGSLIAASAVALGANIGAAMDGAGAQICNPPGDGDDLCTDPQTGADI